MRQNAAFEFEFKNVEKQYECYNGINVKLRYIECLFSLVKKKNSRLIFRYFVRVTVARRLADIIRERDMWVNSYRMPIEVNNSIKMEVGIEDCLHIEFEYNKSK